jgi:Spy/CpxP family protein refolding chaperone
MRFGATAALVVLTLLPGVGRAWAAEPPRDRARTYLMLRLVDALDLPDDKALAVRTVFQKAEERRATLEATRRALDKRLRKALGRPKADASELERLVRDANTVDRELAAVAEDSFVQAQKLLTPEQQAKLLLLRYELQGQVGDAMRRRLGQRGRGGAPHGQSRAR